jgi:hypothetical protein
MTFSRNMFLDFPETLSPHSPLVKRFFPESLYSHAFRCR